MLSLTEVGNSPPQGRRLDLQRPLAIPQVQPRALHAGCLNSSAMRDNVQLQSVTRLFF